MLDLSLLINSLKEERKQEKDVKQRLYKNLAFSKLDTSLLKNYRFKNPYRISKNYLKSTGMPNIHLYGETPLPTMELIAKECDLSKADTLLEMGSGRGRLLFFIHHFYQCQVIGYEKIPEFAAITNQLIEEFSLKQIECIESDMLKADLSLASVIYLYGSCLEDEEIELLVQKFSNLKAGVKIVTISYPLKDYAKDNTFTLAKEFPVCFPWGKTSAYLNITRGHNE
ncbi:MAG: class I SAM-dependent methyltransferase [Simkaniaceae bacterium]|nr:class I SAM-dependent methyltransferase [Simkaniaceae bacterium]